MVGSNDDEDDKSIFNAMFVQLKSKVKSLKNLKIPYDIKISNWWKVNTKLNIQLNHY